MALCRRCQGEAVVNGHIYPLETGTLILIQRGDAHEIRNTGRSALKTLNFYVPPAYSPEGDELAAGKADLLDHPAGGANT